MQWCRDFRLREGYSGPPKPLAGVVRVAASRCRHILQRAGTPVTMALERERRQRLGRHSMTVRMMVVNSLLRLLFTALALVGPGAIGLAVAACDGTPGASGMIEIKRGAATRTFGVR